MKALPLYGLLVLLVAGCAAGPGITQLADTPDKQGFVVYSSYVAVLETAAEYVQEPGVPRSHIERVQDIDRRARPIAENVMRLSIAYQNGDTDSEPELVAAIQALKLFVREMRTVVTGQDVTVEVEVQ